MAWPSLKAVVPMLVLAGLAQLLSGLPWPRDMTRSQAPSALAAPPAGALSTRGEPPLDRDESAERLRNPLPESPDSLARGQRLFETYCVVCHGAAGKGDGPVGAKLGLKLPELTDEVVAQRPDGYLYGTIRNGGFLMPSYAEVMSPDERWAVVLHLRGLGRR